MILELFGITMTVSVINGLCCCHSSSKSNENRSGIFPLKGSFLQHVTEERCLHTLLDSPLPFQIHTDKFVKKTSGSTQLTGREKE